MIDGKHVLTILAVEDLARAKAFYRKGFDWSLVVDVPVYAEFALPGGMRLGVYERHGFGRNTGKVPARIASEDLAPFELYFHVDDIEPAIQRLKKAGARELSPRQPRDWGDEAAYFADPEGNVIVLARPLQVDEQEHLPRTDIEDAFFNDHAGIAALLKECSLAVPDEKDVPVHMVVARENGAIIGCGGWERFDRNALLRSFAVRPDQRRSGLGSKLVSAVLQRLAADGVVDCFLLTTSAAEFFARFGFQRIDRGAVPTEVTSSRQISTGCCETATCMRRTHA